MSYSIIPAEKFKKQFKKLYKKYRSLPADIEQLSNELADNPTAGIELGSNIYKIRLAIRSKGKGKSGGGRVIYYIVTNEKEIYLASIYDKSEIESLTKQELEQLIKDVLE